MKKLTVVGEIRHYGAVEIEVSDEDFAALMLETKDPRDIIGRDVVDNAWKNANESQNGVEYDYQIYDLENNKVIVDWIRESE